MAEQERLFAAIRNVSHRNVYITSFANKEELEKELKSRQGAIEVVDSSNNYEKILEALDNDTTPSYMERIVERSTSKDGQLNPHSLLWFLKKTI